jgi:hypothetical protein
MSRTEAGSERSGSLQAAVFVGKEKISGAAALRRGLARGVKPKARLRASRHPKDPAAACLGRSRLRFSVELALP